MRWDRLLSSLYPQVLYQSLAHGGWPIAMLRMICGGGESNRQDAVTGWIGKGERKDVVKGAVQLC